MKYVNPFQTNGIFHKYTHHVRIQRGATGGHQKLGCVSNSGQDPLKNHEATEPAFNVGPSLARHLNGVSLAAR